MSGPNPRRLMPIVLIAAVLAMLGLAASQLLRAPQPTEESGRPSDDAIRTALERAAADSVALKTRWVDSVPEVEMGSLGERERETFVRFVNARSCTCGCGYTLGACRNFDPTCEVSGPIVAALLDSIRAGEVVVPSGLRERPAH